jgi:hypothetical protein
MISPSTSSTVKNLPTMMFASQGGERDKLYYKLDNRQLVMASFSSTLSTTALSAYCDDRT